MTPATTPTRDCGRCHACGAGLIRLADGSESCDGPGGCGRRWRLFVHGWRGDLASGETAECPVTTAK
jgi:hypothetical protein